MKRGTLTRSVFFFLLLTVISFGVGNFFLGNSRPVEEAIGETESIAWRSEEEDRTIRVYKSVNEAVVFITTVTLTVDPFDFFPEVHPQKGSGSGVVVDAERGIILTNLHVIENAHEIQIMHANGRSYNAKLLGRDAQYDLAVLELIDPPVDLTAVTFGNSEALAVGQRVLAIGNPFGLNRTLTTGIISSLGRSVKGASGALMKGLIQTDAAINPGNSGGPLLDSDGRMIGLNTAILSQSGDSAGIGFAVPVNVIRRFLPELIEQGRVLRPELGWILVDTNQGPMIRRVANNGPADAAGLQPIERKVSGVFVRGYVRDVDKADLIVAVNKVNVQSKAEVEELLSKLSIEEDIFLTVRRGGSAGKERVVRVNPMVR